MEGGLNKPRVIDRWEAQVATEERKEGWNVGIGTATTPARSGDLRADESRKRGGCETAARLCYARMHRW